MQTSYALCRPLQGLAILMACFLVGSALLTGCETTVYESSPSTQQQPQMSLTEARQTFLRMFEKAQQTFGGERVQGLNLIEDGFTYDDPNEGS